MSPDKIGIYSLRTRAERAAQTRQACDNAKTALRNAYDDRNRGIGIDDDTILTLQRAIEGYERLLNSAT